jgi:hypothetical protein
LQTIVDPAVHWHFNITSTGENTKKYQDACCCGVRLVSFFCGVRVVSFPLGKDRVHQGNCKIPVIY